MSGKKDDGSCDDQGGLEDAVAPMRSFGGAGPAGYSSGPTHVDRADFREGAATDAAEATEAATTAEGETPPAAPAAGGEPEAS